MSDSDERPNKKIKLLHSPSEPFVKDEIKTIEICQLSQVGENIVTNSDACTVKENDFKSFKKTELEVISSVCNLMKKAVEKSTTERKELHRDNKLQIREFKQLPKIPNDIIQLCISNHFSEILSEDTLQIISDYCSHKLIQVIKSGIDCMEFSCRLKFTVSDFNRGLYINEEDKFEILCHQSRLKCKRKKLNISNYDSGVESKNPFLIHMAINHMWLNDCNPFTLTITALPNELQNYFNMVTKVLLSKNEEMWPKVIQDLKTNSSILTLVPYFVNFFLRNMKKLSNDVLRMSVLLNALSSLLSNSYLHFLSSSASKELISSILKILIADVPYPNHGCWSLKDTAAYLLVQILKRNESMKIFYGIIQDLKSVFCDFQMPLISHYGAIVALNAIGVPAIMLAISSHIKSYFKFLSSMNESDFQKEYDIKRIEGQLTQSYYQLVNYFLKHEFNVSPNLTIQHYIHLPFYYLEFTKNNEVFSFLSQSEFRDFYGDSLVQYFPMLNFVSYCVNTKKNVNKKHLYLGVNSSKKIPLTNSESSSSYSTAISVYNASEKDKKLLSCVNSESKKLLLKDGGKKNDKLKTAFRLHSKKSFKLFDDIPLKKCVIKFGKITS